MMHIPTQRTRLWATLALVSSVVTLIGGVTGQPAAAQQSTAPQVSNVRVVPVHQEPRHRLIHSSDQMRVLDVQIQPGDTTLFHTHASAITYVTIGTSSTDARSLGGEWNGTVPRDPPPGRIGAVRGVQSYAEQPLTHQVTNVGSTLFRLIAIATRSGGVNPGSEPDHARRASGSAESLVPLQPCHPGTRREHGIRDCRRTDRDRDGPRRPSRRRARGQLDDIARSGGSASRCRQGCDVSANECVAVRDGRGRARRSSLVEGRGQYQSTDPDIDSSAHHPRSAERLLHMAIDDARR